MNLQEELLKLLLELKKKNQKLTAKWNAGGDQTILNFLIDGNYIDWSQDSVFDKLRTFLVTKFQLPNAGEYYNQGKAEIKLPDYDDNDATILIIYDEFAYNAYDDYEVSILPNEMKYPSNKVSVKLLTALNQSSLSFDGSITFRNNNQQTDFYISHNYLEIQKYKDTVDQIHQYILNFVLETSKGVTHSIELSYNGNISQNEIIFNQFYVIKNYADKDYKNVTMPLFYS